MIYPFISQSSSSNCYLIVDEETALIDSGVDPGRVMEKIEEVNAGLDFLILTHCHFDHIAGAPDIINKFHPEIAVHEVDADFIESADSLGTLSALFGRELKKIGVDIRLSAGDSITLGETRLDVIHTPGHTRGSICLHDAASSSLFSGDTVFVGGVGRTDFPGGNWGDLKGSVRKLRELYKSGGVKTLYPGHGPIGDGMDIENVWGMYFGR